MDSLCYGISSYFIDKPISFIQPEEITKDQQARNELLAADRLGHTSSEKELEEMRYKKEQQKQLEWQKRMLSMMPDDPQNWGY
jgi:hypothetical protein